MSKSEKNKNNPTDVFIRFRQKLFTFITWRIPSKEDAEDILQDVFLRFLQTDENKSIKQVSAWLYKVTRSKIIDYRRKKGKNNIPLSTEDNEDDTLIKEITNILIERNSDPDQEYLRNLIWEEIEDALDELPAEQREIFEQTELNGMSYQEISNASNIPVNTLLSRKHYAVLYLRKKLKHIYEMILYDN